MEMLELREHIVGNNYHLTATFERNQVDAESIVVQFSWAPSRHVYAYAVRDEGFHVALVHAMRANQEAGSCWPTMILRNSEWYQQLVKREAHIQDVWPEVTHYVIQTLDHVLEVLASEPPEIAVISGGSD